MEFYPLDSIASQIKGTNPKASEFIRVGLGIKDYKRGSSVKLQRRAEKASIRARDIPKLGETPTGRPDGRKVLKKLVTLTPELDDFSNDLVNDPIANHEEINTFLNEKGQLKRLSDVYEHLVRGGFKTQPPVDRRAAAVPSGSGRLSLFRTI